MTGLEFAAKKGLPERDQFVIRKKYTGLDKTEDEWIELLKPSHTIPGLLEVEATKEAVEASVDSSTDDKKDKNKSTKK